MAAKKITKKSVTKKAAKKTAAKPVKKAAAKKVVSKSVKKAPAKPAPAKKSVAKKAAKKSVAKKAAKKVVAKKPVAKKVVAKKSPAKGAKPAKPEISKTVTVKKAASRKSAAPKKSRASSLVGTPPPSAPARPKFVPPKADPIPKASAGSGTHSPAFIEKQHQRLLELRDTLVDAMNGMTRDTIRNAPEGSEASGSGQHQGDAGSDAYDRDFALSVLAKEQDALYEIEHALLRIKTGSYGNCEISGRKIPTARLEAIPFARLTVECQADWEKEYGNRRFRPSDEVGFSGGKPQEDEDSVTVSLDEDDE